MLSAYYIIEALEDFVEGIRKVSNGHDNIIAYIIPRSSIDKTKMYTDLNEKPGVYILFNKTSQNKVYIGETDNSIYSRLHMHYKNKDFWDTAIAFLTKTNDMTGSQSKYLEGKLLDKAEELGLETDNSVGSNSSEMPKNLAYDADKWKEQIVEITKYLNLIFFLDDGNVVQTNVKGHKERIAYKHPETYILFGKEYQYDTWRQMAKDICERAIDVIGYQEFKNKVVNDKKMMNKRFALSKNEFREYKSAKDNSKFYYQINNDIFLCLHGNGQEWEEELYYLYELLSGEKLIAVYKP